MSDRNEAPVPTKSQKMVTIPLNVLHRLFSDLCALHSSATHGGRPVSMAGCDECDFICSNVGYLTGDGPIANINEGFQLSVEMPREKTQ